MTIYVPYTYLIGWSKLDIWYYGVRFSKQCNPSDLWNPYKTSSKYVKEFCKLHGDPDVIRVRRTFVDANSARKWELKVLRRLRVTRSERWLNKTDHLSVDPSVLIGKPKSEQCKLKLSIAKKGIPTGRHTIHSEETKEKIRQKSLGRKYSKEINLKKGRKGKENSMYGVNRSGELSPLFGKPLTEEAKQKLRKPKSTTQGMKNKFYITDGSISKKISIGSEIPEGFWKGRHYLPSPIWLYAANRGSKSHDR